MIEFWMSPEFSFMCGISSENICQARLLSATGVILSSLSLLAIEAVNRYISGRDVSNMVRVHMARIRFRCLRLSLS